LRINGVLSRYRENTASVASLLITTEALDPFVLIHEKKRSIYSRCFHFWKLSYRQAPADRRRGRGW